MAMARDERKPSSGWTTPACPISLICSGMVAVRGVRDDLVAGLNSTMAMLNTACRRQWRWSPPPGSRRSRLYRAQMACFDPRCRPADVFVSRWRPSRSWPAPVSENRLAAAKIDDVDAWHFNLFGFARYHRRRGDTLLIRSANIRFLPFVCRAISLTISAASPVPR